jgi:predicted O-methyltransferase YrrM
MSQQQWNDVDDYFTAQLLKPDAALDAAATAITAAGMPPISVSPTQGKLLHLIARIHGARTVLEIGTLGGYSTIWLARALPEDGRVITLEADAGAADIARANLAQAGLDRKVDVRTGLALDTLPTLATADEAPFDLVFIDADKQNNSNYLEWALELTSPGSVIIVDNVVRGGAVADPDSTDPTAQGSRAVIERAGREPRLEATAVQTVGSKGYDGFLLARVVA